MRRRILLTIVAIAALSIAAFGVPLAVAVADAYHNEARLELQRAADANAAEVPIEPGYAGRPVALPVPVPGTSIAIYGPDGRRREGDGPPDADPVVSRAYDGDPADGLVGDDLVVAIPLASSDRVVAIVRAAAPTGPVDARIIRADLGMMGLALTIIAAAVGAATWQSRRIMRPLDALTDNARRLGDGDFDVSTAPSGMAEIDATAAVLHRTAQRLRQVIGRERAFSTDVAHQLRTPLTGLRLTIENVITVPELDAGAALPTALDAVDRLIATTEELLLLAREMSAPNEPTDLVGVLRAVHRDWSAALAERGRLLVLALPPRPPVLAFSGAALYQVLQVLVANSAEHGAGTITITAGVDGAGARLSVTDEGPGLTGDPEEAFARRADRASTRGIGLHLARTLAEAEGGSLTWEPEPPAFVLRTPTPA